MLPCGRQEGRNRAPEPAGVRRGLPYPLRLACSALCLDSPVQRDRQPLTSHGPENLVQNSKNLDPLSLPKSRHACCCCSLRVYDRALGLCPTLPRGLDVDGRLVDRFVPRYLVGVQLEPAVLGGLQSVLPCPVPPGLRSCTCAHWVIAPRSACCRVHFTATCSQEEATPTTTDRTPRARQSRPSPTRPCPTAHNRSTRPLTCLAPHALSAPAVPSAATPAEAKTD